MSNGFYRWGVYLYFIMLISWLLGMSAFYYSCSFLLDFYLFSFMTYPVYFHIVLDWVGLFFLSIISFISGSVMFFSVDYMSGDYYFYRFLKLVLMFVLSMYLMVLSPNIVSILLGWDGLGLVSYCLVIYYQNMTAYNAGMITILSNRVGDFGLIMGVVILMSNGWDILSCEGITAWCGSMILLAAFTSSAQFPFSAWLPAAMSAPTPVSALVHSSTLVTAGVFLLIRFEVLLDNMTLRWFILNFSLLTIIFSGMVAWWESDIKKIIAMSTLSQLGFMMLTLSLGAWKVAYFHMLTHALFKSLLFLSAGNILHAYSGVQDMRWLGGMGLWMYSSSLGFLISSCCLGGVPFVAGFYSKELILSSFTGEETSFFHMSCFILGLVLTLMYSLRLVMMGLINMFHGGVMMSFKEEFGSFWAVGILSSVSILAGSSLEWLILEDVSGNFPTIYVQWGILFLMGSVFYSQLFYWYWAETLICQKLKMWGFSMGYLSVLSSFSMLWILKSEPSCFNENYWGEVLGPWGIFQLVRWGFKFLYLERLGWSMMFMGFLLILLLLA